MADCRTNGEHKNRGEYHHLSMTKQSDGLDILVVQDQRNHTHLGNGQAKTNTHLGLSFRHGTKIFGFVSDLVLGYFGFLSWLALYHLLGDCQH